MERRLVPLNAVLALFRGDGGWPAPFRDDGLAVERLELPITTSESVVVIDALGHDDPCQLVVPVEAKGGANLDLDQAGKYLAMTPEDVARVVTMPGFSPRAAIQPVVACLDEHEGRIRRGIERAETGSRSPVGSSGDSGFAILSVSHDRARLEVPTSSALGAFEVEVPGPPPRIIPFDAESSDGVLKEPLVAAITASMASGRDRVAVADLVGETVPYWSVYGRATRNRLARRATQALRTFSEGELSGYFDVVKGAPEHDSDIVRILKSPATNEPQGQTQGWQALKRAAHRGLRKTPAPQIPGQGTFDALLKEAESSEDE